MENVEKLIHDLSWDKPQDVRERAVQELMQVSEEEVVLLAHQSNELCSKECWEDAALVLKRIGYPRNRLAIPYLMKWFMDVNWPGVETVIEILKDVDIDIIMPFIEAAAKQAVNEKDADWCFGLVYLMERLGMKGVEFKDKNLYEELTKLADG